MDLVHRNNVRVSGKGQATLVFAHGFGCDQNMWRSLEPHYADRFQTIRFDHVGSGNSQLSAFDPKKYATLHGYAYDVLEIVGQLASGPAVFVGHSVSAMVGMLANIQRPELFAAQVMIGPSPCFVNDGDYIGGFEREDIDSLLQTLENNFLGWSSTMAPAIMGAPGQPELGVELTNSFCRTDPEISKHFARAVFLGDYRADVPRLAAPTLIVQSDDDLIAPVAVGEYMHRMLARSTLAVIRNVGHCPHLSAPDQCVAAIDRFLETEGF